MEDENLDSSCDSGGDYSSDVSSDTGADLGSDDGDNLSDDSFGSYDVDIDTDSGVDSGNDLNDDSSEITDDGMDDEIEEENVYDLNCDDKQSSEDEFSSYDEKPLEDEPLTENGQSFKEEQNAEQSGEQQNEIETNDNEQLENAEEKPEETKTENSDTEMEQPEETPNSEYIKIGGDSVNLESPYVTERETAEDAGYIEGDGVIDSEKAKEELALPDSNPAGTVHEMPHISENTHDLYVSDVAPTAEDNGFSEHMGGGEQTIAIRENGEALAQGKTADEIESYNPKHQLGEDFKNEQKNLEDWDNKDWESAYTENEIYDSIEEHNEKYENNQLDFYEISNSGENFRRADSTSALDNYYQESSNKSSVETGNENSTDNADKDGVRYK